MRVLISLAASLAVVVAGCTVRVGVGHGSAPVWTAPLPEDVGTLYRALAIDDVVVVVAAGGVLAFDRATGRPRWQKPRSLNSTAPERFLFTDDAMVELGGVVFDLRTGATRFALPTKDVVGTGVTRDALLVATCAATTATTATDSVGSADPSRGCELSARDLRTGGPLWTIAVPAPVEFAMPALVRRSPAPDLVEPMRAPARGLMVAGAKVSRGQRTAPATMRTIDTRTGAVVGTWQVPGDQVPEFFSHSRSRYVGDLLIHADWSAGTAPAPWVYDLRAGVLRWGPTARGIAGGYAFWNSAGVLGSSLLVHDQDAPRAVDLATGAVRWTGEKGFRIVGATGDLAVVLGGGEGRGTPPPRQLSGVGIGTGGQRWTVPMPGWHRVDVAVTDGRVVLSSQPEGTPRLTVLDPRTGGRLWSARRDTRLLGAGADWIVTGRAWHAARGPGEVVLDRP